MKLGHDSRVPTARGNLRTAGSLVNTRKPRLAQARFAARQKLGFQVMSCLFHSIVQPLASKKTPCTFPDTISLTCLIQTLSIDSNKISHKLRSRITLLYFLSNDH